MTMCSLRLLTVLFLLSCAVSATAQPPAPTAEPKSPAAPEAKKTSEPADEEAVAQPTDEGRPLARGLRPGMGRQASLDKRLAALSRLRELLFKEMSFSPERRKQMAALFDDYMAGLLTNTQPPHMQPLPQHMSTPQQLPELERNLAEAKKAGADAETIAAWEAKIYAAKIVLEPNILDDPVYFFDYLYHDLSAEEKSQFTPILERWRMLRVPEIAPDDDFKQLRRATRDPKIRDSEELARKLDELIREAIREVPLGPERLDPKVMTELATRTKPKVLELLTPAQREQLEKTLALLQEWANEDPGLARKEHERLKDHKPGFTQTTPPKESPHGPAQP
jgi:hypothetical protein